MRKWVIAIVALLLPLFLLVGCSEHLPRVNIDTSYIGTVSITIGDNYQYDYFDKTETDSGCEVVIHFKRRENK